MRTSTALQPKLETGLTLAKAWEGLDDMRRLNSRLPELIAGSEIEIYKLHKAPKIKDIEPELRFRLIHNALIDVYELFGVLPDNWPSDNIGRMYINSIVERWGALTVGDLTMCIEVVLQGKVNFELKFYGKFDFDLYAKLIEAYQVYRGQVVAKLGQYDNLKVKYQGLKDKYTQERQLNRLAYIGEIEAIYRSITTGEPVKVIAGTRNIHFAETILKHINLQRPDYEQLLNNAKEIAKELNISPLPLIDLLRATDRSKFTLIPDNEVNKYQCQALVHCGSTLMRCRCPTFKINPALCLAHEKYTLDFPMQLPLVQRLITSEAVYMMKGSDIFTLNGKQCGYYKNSRLTLFEVVD
jgi:hypothetical protein